MCISVAVLAVVDRAVSCWFVRDCPHLPLHILVVAGCYSLSCLQSCQLILLPVAFVVFFFFNPLFQQFSLLLLLLILFYFSLFSWASTECLSVLLVAMFVLS